MRIQKIITNILISIMFVTSLFLTVKNIFSRNVSLIFTDISIFITVPAVFLLRRKFHFTANDILFLILFIFLAQYLGAMLGFYQKIAWYDLFAHGLSGILTTFFGIKFLQKSKNYNKDSIFYNFIFLIGFSLLIAFLWEVGEFSIDYLLGTNLQHNIETGVRDTIEDMMIAFLGSLITYFFYLKNRNSKN